MKNLDKIPLDLLFNHKYIIVTIALALCLAMVFDRCLSTSDKIPKLRPHEREAIHAEQIPEEAVSAASVLKDFQVNSAVAKQRYEGRRVFIRGFINYVEIDNGHGITIHLVGENTLSERAKSGHGLPTNDDWFFPRVEYPYVQAIICPISFNFWYDFMAKSNFDDLKDTLSEAKPPTQALVSVASMDWGEVYGDDSSELGFKRIGNGVRARSCKFVELINKKPDELESDVRRRSR